MGASKRRAPPRLPPVTAKEFENLAAFRYVLARFLNFSEAAAKTAGLTPRQYQALLALKGNGGPLSVGHLAERLHVHHHSAVGLVDRLEALRLVARAADPGDGRRVQVTPTREGDRRVERLAAAHREELKSMGSALSKLLGRLSRPAGSVRKATGDGPAARRAPRPRNPVPAEGVRGGLFQGRGES